MTPTDDLVHHFAEFIASTRYERLPRKAVEAAKKSVLDTIGVTLAASGLEPAVRPVIDFVRETGGRAESSLLGFGGRAPAVMAAFANGALAHCLDYDDHTPWGQHASTSIVPAALAVAERQGGVSGVQMIAAVAAGQDMFARLRCNVGWRKDWNLSTVLGVFSGAAAAASILGLSRAQIANALGIACMQSSGIMEVVAGVGSDLRGMYAGFSAKGAVLAALLAEKGVGGVGALFEGPYGVFNTYFGGKYDVAKILDNLGTEYHGAATLYKPWPAVGTSHSHIHATIGIVTEHDLRADDMDRIRVHVGDYHSVMCTPIDTRRAPTTLVDARFSLPYLVAVAAVRRSMGLRDFTLAALRDADVLRVAQKVVPVTDSSLDWNLELPPGRVDILTRDGRMLTRTGTRVPGSPDAPLTWDDITRKFSQCASFAAVPVSMQQATALHEMVRDFESVRDVADLLRVIQ